MDKLLKDIKTQYLLAFLLIFGAVFLLFHDLFFGKIIATNDISTNDLLYFNLPVRKLFADALKNGELLQWTPFIYGGFPVFAEGQGGFLYPLNLVIWYILNPIGAMNVYIIFHALLMGMGVYLLVSKLTGNKLLSIPSGVAASICGSLIAGHTRHLNSLAAIVYAPWLIYSIELFLRTKKVSKGLVFGIFLGLLLLIGHPQFSFISGFLALLYLFLRIFFEKSSSSFFNKLKTYKVIQFLVLSLIISAVIGFFQLKSTLELLPLTERGQNLSSEFTGHGSLPFNGILTFVYPYYMGNVGNGTFQSTNPYFFWEFFHYTGAIVFILAIFGSIKMWKRREYHSSIRSLVMMAIISLLLALGENLPVYKIFSLFPFTKSFRFPVRWLLGTELSILILSGFGVLSLIEFISVRTRQIEKKNIKKAKSSGAPLIKLDEVPLITRYKTVLILSVIIPIEIFLVAGRQVATADAGIYLNPPSFVDKVKNVNKNVITSRILTLSRVEFFTAAFQKSNGWEGKHDLYGLGTKLLPDELGAYFGAPIIQGYFLLVPRYIYEVWGDADHSGLITKTASLNQNKFFQPTDKFVKLSKLFGVKYLTTAWNISAPYEPIWDSLGIRAYELPDTMSKAWVVSKVESFSSDVDKINSENLINNNFDPWKSAYVDGISPNLPSESQNGKAEIIKYENHTVTIRANSPGFVVINDTWYPRWRAYIDGAEVPVYKTNVMMRGVVAPKSGTIIEMKFDTGNIFIFTIISYLTILASLGYLYYKKLVN